MAKERSRTRNSARNMVVAILLNATTIICGLVVQRIFLSILNTEYLGLNSLFSNILTMLGVAELGVTNAVIFSMYKPLAEGDKKTIRALMRFYRKWYAIVGFIVMGLGLIIMPFIPAIVGEQSLDINLYVIYGISLADIVFSYFLGYKRSIIYASQQNYIIDLTQVAYTILVSFLQMLVLYLTRNYYLYAVVRLVLRVSQNVVLIFIANKMFPYITEPNAPELSKTIQKSIVKKVKGLFYHKVSAFIVLSTDNIIITVFLGLSTGGLYASYYMIISALQSVIYQCIAATTASVGNLLVKESKEKQFEVFRRIRFMNFWLATLGAAGIITVMGQFVEIWLGHEYLLSFTVLAILTINFHSSLMRAVYGVFKDAAGIFHEDRFIPVIESLLNIVASVILVQMIGLPGVFIGTFISGLVLHCFSYPKFVYHGIFKRSYASYAIETIGYAILGAIICGVTLFAARGLTNCLHLEMMANLIFNIIVVLVIPNILMFAIFSGSDEMNYCKDMAKKILRIKKHAD